MGLFKPPAPPSVPMPPPAAHPSTLGSASLAGITAATKQRAATAEGQGMSGTNATGPEGLTTKPDTAKTTLLGG